MPNLMDILPEKFRDGLTEAEKKLLAAAPEGKAVNLRIGDKERGKPENAKDWGPERTIRAKLIRWLCADKEAAELVDPKGLVILGVRIEVPLDLACVEIPFRVGLIGCAIKSVNLMDASARTLIFSNSVIGGFVADRLKTTGGLFLRSVKTSGEVWLPGAEIGGDLDCIGAEFNNPEGYALCTAGVKVKGDLFLRNVKANGEVGLPGAEIGGNLECAGAEFNNPEGDALNADTVKIKGYVFLKDGFKATGEVRFLGADIGGDLDCIGAEFNNPGGVALYADRVKVKGNLFLSNVKANGEVRLLGAKIGSQLACSGAELNNPEGDALNCLSAHVTGVLFLNEVKGIAGKLDLTHAKADALVDDEGSWPKGGYLYIDGFEYGGLPGDPTPKTASERIEWLHRQADFTPRPYEQLAKVFREMGKESDAREVLIAKHEDLREHGGLGFMARVWNRFLDVTIKYGYKPWRAVAGLAIFLGAGWFVFWTADGSGLMVCVKECRGQTFSPLLYSLDTLLPIIDFHQKGYFLPDATAFWGKVLRAYFCIHIAAGWTLSTLLVASLTGLIHRGKE